MKTPFQQKDEIQGVDRSGDPSLLCAPLDITPLLNDPIYTAPAPNAAATQRTLTLRMSETERQEWLQKGGTPNKDEVITLLRDSTWKAANNIRALVGGALVIQNAAAEKLKQEASKWLLEQFLGKAAQLDKPHDLDSLTEAQLIEIATTGTLSNQD
jgi:hypothetical protein